MPKENYKIIDNQKCRPEMKYWDFEAPLTLWVNHFNTLFISFLISFYTLL